MKTSDIDTGAIVIGRDGAVRLVIDIVFFFDGRKPRVVWVDYTPVWPLETPRESSAETFRRWGWRVVGTEHHKAVSHKASAYMERMESM